MSIAIAISFPRLFRFLHLHYHHLAFACFMHSKLQIINQATNFYFWRVQSLYVNISIVCTIAHALMIHLSLTEREREEEKAKKKCAYRNL